MLKEQKISVILIQDNGFNNLDMRLSSINKINYVNEVFVISDKKIDFKNLRKKYSSINLCFKLVGDSFIEIINQSILNIKNRVFVILERDEFFFENSLNNFIEKIISDSNIGLLYGNSILFDYKKNFLGFGESLSPSRFLENYKNISEITIGSYFFKKELFIKLGFFKKKYKHHYLLEFIIRAIKEDFNAIKFSPDIITCKYFNLAYLDKFINFEKNLELLELVFKTSNNTKFDALTKKIFSSIVLLKNNEINSILDKNHYSAPIITKLNFLRDELKKSLGDFDNSKFLKSIPHDLRIILESRLDLQNQGFNLKQNERKFCLWIIKYGFKEYPPLGTNNCEGSTLYWLKKSSDAESISRMNLAIFDSNKIFRKLYKLIKFKSFKNQFISFVWPFLPYNLPSQSFFYGFKNKGLNFHKIAKKSKRIRSIEFKNNLIPPKEGVNLIGYAKHALGIGEDLRSTFFALGEVKISTSIINFPPGSFKGREENTLKNKIKNVHLYNTTILCLTAEESLRYFMKLGTLEFENRYIIGYWPWELPIWPKNWVSAIEYVNEIWVSSQHIKDSLKGVTNKPVKLMPLCIDQPSFKIKQQSFNQRIFNRKRFDLDKKSIYLCFSFDQNSYMERKNPWDALRAFQMAFPPMSHENSNDQVKLLIKTFPNTNPSYEWGKLKSISELDPRIIILEKNMSRIDLLDLYGCCDIFISLHRAEGYGRCLAEALQLGLDLVATNWSGNTDFCRGPLYHPVPYSIEAVKPFDYPYWQNQYWAQPDLIKAANILKKVVKKRIEKGLPEIEISENYQNYFSAKKCGLRYKNRLEELNLINATPKFH